MKLKNILLIILITIILLASLIILVIYINQTITARAIQDINSNSENQNDIYSYTKTICNQTNFCQGYLITCNNSQLISQTPIKGTIQHSPDWKDPRTPEQIEKMC